MDRPTFMHDGQPVRAAGLLVYVSDMDRVHVLFRHAKGKITDIGGKTDPEDTCVEDTVIREVWETNGNLYGEMPLINLLDPACSAGHHSTRRFAMQSPSIFSFWFGSHQRFGVTHATFWEA